MTDAHQRAAVGTLRVVLTYTLFGGLWILLSDRAIGLLFSRPETLVRASTAKGWLFVAVTGLLLYALMRRLTGALVDAHQRELAFARERERPPPMLVAIADASADAIYAKDDEGRYLLFNNAAARIAGKSAEEVLGKDDRALFPLEQAQALMVKDRRLRTTGASEAGEESLQTVDGRRVFLSTKGPLRGVDGRIFGTYGISRDITERKRTEEASQRLADDLGATLQAIPDPMFELDEQGRYLAVKALNESLLAAPPGQLIGRTVRDVLPAGAAATVMQALAAAGHAGTDFGRTFSQALASGDRHFELSVARKPVLPGQGERFIALARDVTARTFAESELRQRNDELERFNRAATERELRMVALKREVNELARACGRPAPYDVAFADAPATPAMPAT